jgi:hypothetical protein
MRRFNYRTTRKRASPEGALVLQIIKSLRARGWEAWKIKTQGSPKTGGGWIIDRYRLLGWGDVIAWVTPARLYMFEVKAGTAYGQTDNQSAFEKIWHYPPGREYHVIHSWADVERVIK